MATFKGAGQPIWSRIQENLASKAVSNVMPKEPFVQSLTYLRNQFDHPLVYLDDGLMSIDNNKTEQLMKQVALGRKTGCSLGASRRATALRISCRS